MVEILCTVMVIRILDYHSPTPPRCPILFLHRRLQTFGRVGPAWIAPQRHLQTLPEFAAQRGNRRLVALVHMSFIQPKLASG